MRASIRAWVLLLIVGGLSGCMSAPTAPPASPVSAEQARDLAGAWQGWLVTEQSFALFNLAIKTDGTFEVTGRWTRAHGMLLAADGTLRFDGTGPWRGTLTLEHRGGSRALKLERDDRLVRGYLHRVGDGG